MQLLFYLCIKCNQTFVFEAHSLILSVNCFVPCLFVNLDAAFVTQYKRQIIERSANPASDSDGYFYAYRVAKRSLEATFRVNYKMLYFSIICYLDTKSDVIHHRYSSHDAKLAKSNAGC